MESHQRTETYRGHTLRVEARQQRARAWSWTYSIDSKVYGRSPTARLLPDAEAALRRGLLAARARVDELV